MAGSVVIMFFDMLFYIYIWCVVIFFCLFFLIKFKKTFVIIFLYILLFEYGVSYSHIAMEIFKMSNNVHRNPIQIGTCSNEFEKTAINEMKYRELLYNRDDKTLGIIIDNANNEKHKQILSAIPDEYNVTLNNNKNLAFKDDITTQTYLSLTEGKGTQWKAQYFLYTTTDDSKIFLLFKKTDDISNGVGIIGGELFETGENYYGHYQITVTANGTRFIKGAETNNKKAKIVLAKYNNEYYYGIKFLNNVNVHLVGWKKIDENILPSDAYSDYDLSNVIELSDDSKVAPQILDYEIFNPTKYNNTWDFNDASISASNLIKEYDFGKNLTLLTEAEAIYKPEEVVSSDTGYIALAAGNDFKLKLVAPCTVVISCGSNEDKVQAAFSAVGTNTRRVTTNSISTIAKITYTKTTSDEEELILSHTGAVGRYYSIAITYKSDTAYTDNAANYVANYVKSLEKTGVEGTPHFIKITGILNKNFIISLASALRDPEKQISLDLSEAIMNGGFTDWTNDYTGETSHGTEDSGGLYSAFYGCTSLKSFYYPSQTATSGGNTFYGCTSLTDVHFNNEMTQIGAADNWVEDSIGMFSGTKVKSVVIPSSIQSIGNYSFSQSNVENLYFKDGSYFETTDDFNAHSSTWIKTNQSLKLYCCETLKTAWDNDTATTFDGADGYSTKYLSSTELRCSHTASWDNDETKIDYEA